jgi:outer membrane protein TolC
LQNTKETVQAAQIGGWMLIGVLMALITGCQSYEREPLDFNIHREVMAMRLAQTEPLEAFTERLEAAEGDAPMRFDVTDGVALEEAEVLALFYRPELRMARAKAGVARAEMAHAGLWEDPEFGFDAAEVLSADRPFEYGLTLSLTIPISGRLEVAKARAGAAYEEALRGIVDAEWTTRAALRIAWFEWTAARERAEHLRQTVEQVRRIQQLTGELESVGELSRVESRLFRVELANRQAALDAAVVRAEEARIELLALMGLPPDADIELVPGMPRRRPTILTSDIDYLIEHNTELATARAAYEVAEQALRLEIRKQYPDIVIGGGYGEEENEDRLLLGLSVPIPILNANRGGIAEAKAQRDVARTHVETTFERLVHELAAAKMAHQRAQRQRELYERELSPMLAEQATEVERIAQLGEVDALLLLDTVTRQFETKSRLLDLKLMEHEAAVTIERLLGPAWAAEPALVELKDQHQQDSSDMNADGTATEGAAQ